jgi:uncharacterized membrane protein
MTRREAVTILLTFVALFGFGLITMWVFFPAVHIPPIRTLLPGEDAAVALNELESNTPKLFSQPLKAGSTAEFLVERDENDRIIVAFASCRKCYRSGHYRQGRYILCGQCKEAMVRAVAGETPPTRNDCTQIPIPFERSGDRLTVRARAVNETFTRWYGPVISQDRNEGTTTRD